MIVTIKTLQQETFTIEVELTEKVADLKQKIFESRGKNYPANLQKLIYAGKIMEDEVKLSEYNLDEKKFVVVMVSKVLAGPNSSASSASADTKKADQPSTSKAVEEKAPFGDVSQLKIPTGQSDVGAQSSDLGVTSEQFELLVKNIMDMGYLRSEVERALKASFMNPDRAVEYLINGIPEAIIQDQLGDAIAQASQRAETGNPLAFLKNLPQFEQMRKMVHHNPDSLNSVIQTISSQNPELLQVISENREAFIRMLNEPDYEPEGGTPADTDVTQPAAGHTSGGGEGARGDRVEVAGLLVSQHDKAAIERLKALGFEETMCIQAYFACEKNENMAANFLLSQGYDD